MGISTQTLGLAANTIKSGGGTALNQFLNQISQGNIDAAAQTLGEFPRQAIDTIGAFGQATPGDGLRGMNARSDAIQNWCWYCLLPTFTNRSAVNLSVNDFLPSTFSSGTPGLVSTQAFKPSLSLPWYYVQRSNLPFRRIETESVKRNSHMIHYPTGYSVDSLTLEFFMDSANLAQTYLKAWGAAVLNSVDPGRMENRGQWGLPASYKKDINIYVLSVSKQVLLNFRYFGCWPSEQTALELVSDNAAALSQPVTFQVEDVAVTVNNDKRVIDNLAQTAVGIGISALQGAARSFLDGINP